MPFQRNVILGVVGDSAAGKTTITKDIARVLGDERVTVICTDDYHRYNRKQRKELNINALDPACNYIDIMEQHLDLLRRGHPILKPVYNHSSGDFDPPEYIEPREFIIAEGLLGFHTKALRRPFDIKVFLSPEEDLRIQWKIKRDTAKRGYTDQEVLAELEMREPYSAAYIRPQQDYADIVISFKRPAEQPQEAGSHLDVQLKLRPTLPHPDLTEIIERQEDHALSSDILREEGRLVEAITIDGNIQTEQAAQIEKIIRDRVPDLRLPAPDDFGEYQDGREKRQSHTLALSQLLIAYHMLLARKELELEIAERVKKLI
jgi:phosphoribulokinase